jgi:transcriptional regulator with XRE-family HTH domain
VRLVERESVGRLIARLRAGRGLTQGQLATYAKVTRAWLSLVETDKIAQPERERLERVALVLHVPADTLLAAAGYRVGPPPPPPERSPEDALREALALLEKERRESETTYRELPGKVVMVPIVKSFAAAGEGAVAEVEHWPYIPKPEELGHEFTAIRVQGKCLEPRVRDGDVAVVDKNAIPKSGDVVAIQYDGESLVRVYEGDRLTALNGHPPIPIDSRVHLEGVVVFSGRRP